MWLERIALLSFFLLITVQTVCLNLDAAPEDQRNWFYVLSPLWWLFAILFILLIIGWGEFCCIACSSPDIPPPTPAAAVLDQRRRKRKPSDAVDLLASSISWVFFLFITILLAYFLNGSHSAGIALVVLLVIYQILLLIYLFAVSYYNTLRRETKNDSLSYGSCLRLALRCTTSDARFEQTESQPIKDLSVCGDAGLGRCKCTAGFGSPDLTWVDWVQSVFIYSLLIASFLTTLLLYISLVHHPIHAAIVLAPLYVAIGALVVNSFCLVYQIARRREGGYEWATYLSYVGFLILLFIFLILLAVKLDTDTIESWFYVFLPLTIALFATTVVTFTLLCCPPCRKMTGRDKWGVVAREPQRAGSVVDAELETEVDELNL